MCGITGIFHFDESRNADHALLKRMTDAIAHRGPMDKIIINGIPRFVQV